MKCPFCHQFIAHDESEMADHIVDEHPAIARQINEILMWAWQRHGGSVHYFIRRINEGIGDRHD